MKDPVYYRRFDYDRRLLPNRYLASLDDGVTSIDEARKRTGASIGYPGWGFLYHLMLCHLVSDSDREQVVIETGTNWGCTTIILAQALEDTQANGYVVTFEIDPKNAARAQANIKASGLSGRVRIVEGDSREQLARYKRDEADIRFALLDASHLFADVLSEFEALYPKLADDALVILDNTYAIAGPGEDSRVNGALPEIVKRYGGNLINLEFVSWFTPGLAMWQRRPKL